MKKLFLVETQREVETFCEQTPEFVSPENAILSFSPEASVALKEKNLVYWTTENFLDKEGHARGVLCVDRVTRALIDDLVICDAMGLQKTYVNALNYFLRPYLTYLIFNFEVINDAISKFKPEALQFFYYENPGYSSENVWPREWVLGHQAALFSTVLSIRMNQSLDERFLPNKVNGFARNSLDCLMNVMERICLPMRKYKHPILAYSMKFNFDVLANELPDAEIFNVELDKKSYLKMKNKVRQVFVYSAHLNPLNFSFDQKFQKDINQIIVRWQKKHDAEKILSWQGMDFSKLVFDKLRKCYVPALKRIHTQACSLTQWFEALKPKVVVAPMSRSVSYAMGEIAKIKNVPSFLVSHGSHIPPQDDFSRREWEDHGLGLIDTAYSYHALQTPWAVKYVETMKSQGNYLNIKPHIFQSVDLVRRDQLRKKLFPDLGIKKIVMHAGTPKSRLSARFYIYETTDEYIKNMADLVEATRFIKDVFLVLRFRPLPDISLEHLKKLLPSGNHYTIASGGSFYDYLCVTDLLVSFSSTTIEEALLSQIPVLQYDPTDRYCHIPGKKASEKGFDAVDSVYFVGQQQLLKSSLEWILANHLQKYRDLPRDLFKRHAFDASTPTLSQVIRDVLAGKTVNSWQVADIK